MTETERNLRKTRTGIVTSSAMDKTIVVEVGRRMSHPLYGKVVNRKKKYHAHDEKNEAHKGDQVRIAETRPLSRLKRLRLLEIIKKAAAE